jgi:hypothetical protein
VYGVDPILCARKSFMITAGLSASPHPLCSLASLN